VNLGSAISQYCVIIGFIPVFAYSPKKVSSAVTDPQIDSKALMNASLQSYLFIECMQQLSLAALF
jgi:hypothetical protein